MRFCDTLCGTLLWAPPNAADPGACLAPQEWATHELLDGLQSARAMVASMPGLFNALLVADALVAQHSAAP